MTRLVRFAIFLGAILLPATATTFSVGGGPAGPWTAILGSIGISYGADPQTSSVLIATASSQPALARLAEDRILILEGNTPLAQSLGFVSRSENIPVRQIVDTHAPSMQIIWEKPVMVPAETLPAGFQVFATEKWKGIPVLAGKRTSHGAILWMATGPDRYPYLLQALADLGLPLPVRSTTLWAFFDSAYRIRADSDYLAKRWRDAGVSELHVAAWHNMEPDPVQDSYLKNLIEACHRHAILVYAWFELPHVSEKFWADHPAWREKTALGQDAQLDWRKLMNLQNPDCKREAAKQVNTLLQRFDWDGVNLAELYFESLEGASNPARFTPMNDDVRSEFREITGWDPKLLFDPASAYYASKNPHALRQFLDFRTVLASRMQDDWLNLIGKSKTAKPYLGVVLTHIDDRFQPGIRDELGADIARSLPKIQAHKCTLLVEDPATLWDLGPDRYAKLATKYHELNPNRSQIAIDINVVERYQDVYPTKKQTGLELFELVHQAASSFGQVALYFENSLEKQDLPLLPIAAATAQTSTDGAGHLQIDSQSPVRVLWHGPAAIDGQLWPAQNADTVLVPAGHHTISAAAKQTPIAIADFNGEIQSATVAGDKIDLAYISQGRALARFNTPPAAIEIDGIRYQPEGDDKSLLLLPAGQHVVTVVSCPPKS